MSLEGWRKDFSWTEGVLLFFSLLEDKNSRTFAAVRGIPRFSGEERMLAKVFNGVMSTRRWKSQADFKKSLIDLPTKPEDIQEVKPMTEEEIEEIFSFVTIADDASPSADINQLTTPLEGTSDDKLAE